MKDYTIFNNNEGKMTFILNYKVEEKEIKINFANGDKISIPYTEENEKKVIDKMTNQAEMISNIDIDKIKTKKFYYYLSLCFPIYFIISSTYIGLYQGISGELFGNIIALPCLIYICSKIRYWREFHKDIKKVKKFLNSEENLNQNIRKNENMLYKVSNKTKGIVDSTPVEQPVFTINTIEKMKYEDLKQILENIKRENEFVFDYPNDVNTSSLTRKREK